MNKNIIGIALTSMISLCAGAAHAESAVRGSFAEVRPNGSSQSASFEHILPENFYFGSYDPTAGNPGSTLTITVNNAGTNESELESLTINAGPALSTAVDYEGNALIDTTSVEDAIAKQIDNIATSSAEDVTGYIRAFVGADGASLD